MSVFRSDRPFVRLGRARPLSVAIGPHENENGNGLGWQAAIAALNCQKQGCCGAHVSCRRTQQFCNMGVERRHFVGLGSLNRKTQIEQIWSAPPPLTAAGIPFMCRPTGSPRRRGGPTPALQVAPTRLSIARQSKRVRTLLRIAGPSPQTMHHRLPAADPIRATEPEILAAQRPNPDHGRLPQAFTLVRLKPHLGLGLVLGSKSEIDNFMNDINEIWRRGRPSCFPCPTSTLCSHCRPRSATSPIGTRPSSTTCS